MKYQKRQRVLGLAIGLCIGLLVTANGTKTANAVTQVTEDYNAECYEYMKKVKPAASGGILSSEAQYQLGKIQGVDASKSYVYWCNDSYDRSLKLNINGEYKYYSLTDSEWADVESGKLDPTTGIQAPPTETTHYVDEKMYNNCSSVEYTPLPDAIIAAIPSPYREGRKPTYAYKLCDNYYIIKIGLLPAEGFEDERYRTYYYYGLSASEWQYAIDSYDLGLSQKCEDQFIFGGIICPIADFISGSIDVMINNFLLPMLQWRVLV